MSRPMFSAELRDYASFLLGKYHEDALAKVDERVRTLTQLGQRHLIVDWLAIGEEIAAILSTDTVH